MNELSLFTGAGGGLLASKYMLGFKTVGYVEYGDYPQRVLAQRIKDGFLDNAPIFGDIRSFINYSYAQQYKGLVDIITAGFPCQPYSVAGKQLGAEDPRDMWPSTWRVIEIVRPRWVLLENVPGLVSSGYIGGVLKDLSQIGYDAKWQTLSAQEAGFFHKRERLWIVAHSKLFKWHWGM